MKQQKNKKKETVNELPKIKSLPVYRTLFSSINDWLFSKEKILLTLSLCLFLFLSVFSFDSKLSIAHDDALYLESAYRMVHDFPNFFHTANSPLYPLFLSLLVAIFGFHYIFFKILSIIFISLSIYLIYKALRNRVPNILLWYSTIMLSVNYYIIYYSHHTFTEPFFMFLQACLFYTILTLADKLEKGEKIPIQNYLVCGLIATLVVLTKSISIGLLGAVIGYFIIFHKSWKVPAIISAIFLAFYSLFNALKFLIWGDYIKTIVASQLDIILRKEPYKPELGNEDIAGFIQRFFDNYGLYISKRFYDLVGITHDAQETNTALGLFTLLLLGTSIYFMFKIKNKAVVLMTFYSIVLSSLSFVALQKEWDQLRIVMIYLPFYLIFLLYGLYELANKKNNYVLQLFFVMILIILPFVNIKRSLGFLNENLPYAIKSFKGDKYAGYTPDYLNYALLSEWCGENLDRQKHVVACRKPPVSFVYSKGMNFTGIYLVPSQDADSLVSFLEERKATHVIVANLRRNPKKKDGYIINTVHRFLNPVITKYPFMLKEIHKVGNTEEAQLFEITYDRRTNEN